MNPELPDPGDDHPHRFVSRLADGDAQALDAGCALWRSDPEARARWHAYHLIGDVLRSDELASPPGHDAAFLDGLRDRLAHEPVPLAPTPVRGVAPAAARARLGWRAPAAIAAGFVAVAGVLVVLQRPSGNVPAAAPSLALAPADRPAALTTAPTAPTAPTARENRTAVAPPIEPRLVLSGGQLRDPDLDAYLRAHQAARGGMPAALPGGALRSVDMIVAPGMPAPAGPPGGSRGLGLDGAVPTPAVRALASGAAR